MATIADLATAIATLKTDTSKALADIAAKLAAIPTTDPATQAAIDQAVTDITNLDSQIKGADPGTPAAGTTPAIP